MASIQKRSGKRGTTYRVMWRLSSGEQRSQTVKTRDEARALKVEVEALEQAGRTPDAQRGAITLAAWAGDYLATLHLKPKSRVTYESLLRSRILPELGDRALSDISRLDVQQWVAAMADEVSASRTKAARAFLSQMLAEAVRHDRLARNPAEGVRVPPVAKTHVVPLRLDELRAAASHCGRYEALVLWLGLMGTRWAETIGLTWDKLRDGVVTVDCSLSEVNGRFHRVPTKTFESRQLPVPPALLEMLPLDRDGYVFTTTYGNPVRSARFRAEVFLPALERAGLKQMKIHHLRHSAASFLIHQGANPKMVQVWMGHKDIKVTMDVYAHLFPSDLDQLSFKLDALMREPSI